MKPGRRKVISFILASAILPGCLSVKKPPLESIYEEMKLMRGRINRTRDGRSLIKKKKTGESGFYYVIDHEGKILNHPRELLVGSNFGRFPFIRKILEKRSGCISYYSGEIRQLVLFIPLSEDKILCLSIPEDEVKNGSVSCQRISPR